MATPKKPKKRPVPKRPPQARGEPFVAKVLEATLKELVRVGFAALRVDDVAERAGVNKTSVYRRWPTKGELVRAAIVLMASGSDRVVAPDHDSIRDDLEFMGRIGLRIMGSTRGRAILRVLFAEGADPALVAVARSIQKERLGVVRQMVDRAIARGEIDPKTDPNMVIAVMVGTLRDQIIIERNPVDEAFLHQLIEFVLRAVRPQR